MAAFSYAQRSDWPPLAWVARVPHRRGTTKVEHGRSVETHPDWFGDAVWNGPFSLGGLDESDVVFGSGGRHRGDAVVFVSSVAMVDRLQSYVGSDGVWVSNSLVALLSSIGAGVAPLYRHYPRDFRSVINGFNGYERDLTTSHGPIRLTYFRNLRVAPDSAPREEMKPHSDHALGSYDGYREFLEGSIERLAENASDMARRNPLSLLGTISSGFDSTTAVALARPAGLQEAFTITTARGGEADSGQEIGRRLGVDVHPVSRDAWRDRPFVESLFLASDAKGEDVYFSGAQDLLENKLVVTGFGATGVWGSAANVSEELQRRDQSGLSLTEYRLHAGFVHLPVPAIGAIYGDRIRGLYSRPDMAEWMTGGPGDKPFARRLLVEEGVPSHMFGQRFKAASVLFFDRKSFLTPPARFDFERFLQQARTEDKGRAALNAAADLPGPVVSAALRGVRSSAMAISHLLPGMRRVADSARLARLADAIPEYRYLFPWAVAQTRRSYAGDRPDS